MTEAEIALYEDSFAGIERKLIEMRGEMVLLRWMVGLSIALNLGILGKLFHG